LTVYSVFITNHIIKKRNNISNGLVISSGFQTTHILPVLNSQFIANSCKRINIGGTHSTEFILRQLLLKYPLHKNYITYRKVQELKHQHAYVATNFESELCMFQSGNEESISKARNIQLPFTAPVEMTEEEKNRKAQLRKEQGLRLKEITTKRRLEKLQQKESKLKELDIFGLLKNLTV